MQKVYIIGSYENGYDWTRKDIVCATLNKDLAETIVKKLTDEFENERKSNEHIDWTTEYYYYEITVATSLEDIL